ncbi:MAG: UvrD-helicase domain-containing protein [Sutterella sp.]|nr:UvrD-helicase domain-containing protein [Sutterella sp.]
MTEQPIPYDDAPLPDEAEFAQVHIEDMPETDLPFVALPDDAEDGAAGPSGEPEDAGEFDVLTAPLTVPTLLEASAGTGKTFSIKHLVLRLVVEEDMPIDRILVVTFTRAATAELASRIQAHLAEASGFAAGVLEAEEVDGLIVRQIEKWRSEGRIADRDIAGRLRAALSGFDNAAIYTIHSFCQKMLTGHAFSASGAFDCEMSEDDADLRRETAEDFLRRELDRTPDADLRRRLMAGEDWEGKLAVLAATTPDLAPRVIREEPGSPEDAVLRRFADEAPGMLRELKARRGMLTFDDLLVDMWLKLREDRSGHLAGAIRNAYRGVLIDEFQDTDPLQFAVFRRLFLDRSDDAVRGGRALFFVGDPKQAVYRFRSADLNTYMKARSLIGRRARLATNFRSSPKLVEAVNAFFSEGQTPGGPGAFLRSDLTYEPVKASSGRTGLWRFSDGEWRETVPMEIWTSDPPFAKADERKAAGREALANDIAELILAGREKRAALAAGEEDEVIAEVESGGRRIALRALRPGDIAILIRKRSSADDIRQVLAERGIRIRMKSSEDVCFSEEAGEVMLILRAFASPADERIMRAARVTRLMGDTLSGVAKSSEEERTRYRELFEEGRRRWQRSGVAAAFARLFEICRTAERVLPAEGGEQRLTNYEHLIELLHEAGKRYDTPTGLIAWFEKACSVKSQADNRTLRLAGDANLVTLETIHSSKGLQYPVVYIPYGEMLSHSKEKKAVFRDLNPTDGSMCVTLTHREETESPSCTREAEEELVRLAYVAITRAAARAVISVPVTAKSAKNGGWHGTMLKSAFFRALAGSSEAGEGDVRRAFAALGAHSDAVLVRDVRQPAGRVAALPAVPEDEAQDAFGTDPASDVEPAWRISSFTGLTRMMADDDAGMPQRWFGRARRPRVMNDILSFPRGTQPGDCLHCILEEADFQALAPDTPEAQAARLQLARSVIERRLTFESDDARHSAVEGAAAMIYDVLNAEILPGIRLRDVPPGARSAEMPFLISMGAGVTAERLGRFLETLGPAYAVPGLTDESLAGYLTGFIDLAFGAGGRFWILDWKSNAIPDHVRRAADFTQEVMAAEMTKHHYRLQYLIYLVALRRFLRARLGPDYRDDLIGGAVYVFLRGVRAGAVRTAEGIQGAVFDPVPPAAVAGLDRFFAGEDQ